MMALLSACFQIYSLDDYNKQECFDTVLIHEVGEVTADDITELDERHATKHELEEIGVINTFKCLKTGDYFISLWETFEARKTKEAKFIYQLDKNDPVMKAKYLDKELGRNDLFQDFYSYEEKRGTFEEGPLRKLFYEMKR